MKKFKKIAKICPVIFIIFIFILIFSLFLPIIYLKFHYKTTYKNIIESELKLIENKNDELTTAFVLSIILAESGFNENAKSSKDAFGLMQLTFPTATEVAQKLGIAITLNDLFNPKINIKLGVNYLQYLFNQTFTNEKEKNENSKNQEENSINQNENCEKFSKTQLVLLSYNAGINRVKTWLENDEITLKNGFCVCPFNETTNYVKKVINNEKIYNKII